ncbi:MAG: hypothetical protein ACKN9D_07785, partial [Actinomycetales bacterium]
DRMRLGLGMDREAFEVWLSQGTRNRALGVTTSAVHGELRGDVRASIDAVSDAIKDLSGAGATIEGATA